jgi:uncharacterized protein YjiS (DUF1127 family)
MALLQTDRDSFVGYTDAHSPSLAQRMVQFAGQALRQAVSPLHAQFARMRRRSQQQRVRAGLTRAERARQRRILAALSDRELRDIGITRYDVEFLLRQKTWH